MDRAERLNETIKMLMEDAEHMQKSLDSLAQSGVVNMSLRKAVGITRMMIGDLIADLRRELESK